MGSGGIELFLAMPIFQCECKQTWVFQHECEQLIFFKHAVNIHDNIMNIHDNYHEYSPYLSRIITILSRIFTIASRLFTPTPTCSFGTILGFLRVLEVTKCVLVGSVSSHWYLPYVHVTPHLKIHIPLSLIKHAHINQSNCSIWPPSAYSHDNALWVWLIMQDP